MLIATAYGLALVLNLFLLFIAARFLLQPVPAAAGYGVPSRPSAYLTIKGLRELGYGVLGLALLAFAGAHPAGWFMLVTALNPLGDTLIVLRNGGPKTAAFGIHFATALVMLISAALLFAS